MMEEIQGEREESGCDEQQNWHAMDELCDGRLDNIDIEAGVPRHINSHDEKAKLLTVWRKRVPKNISLEPSDIVAEALVRQNNCMNENKYKDELTSKHRE